MTVLTESPASHYASLVKISRTSDRRWMNYIDPSLKDWPEAYYAHNLQRLKATRRRIDPDHYFNFPQAIGR